MSNEMNVNDGEFDKIQALEYYNRAQQNQQKVERVKNDFQTTPEQDEFVKSDNKTAKTVGIIGGLIAAAAIVVGAICLKKGGKALENKKDASFTDKIKEGWKELRGKGKSAEKEVKDKAVDEKPKTDEKNIEQSANEKKDVDEKPKTEEKNIEQSANEKKDADEKLGDSLEESVVEFQTVEESSIVDNANPEEFNKIVELDGKKYEQYVDSYGNLCRNHKSLLTTTRIEYEGIDESQYRRVVTNRLTGKKTTTVHNANVNYVLVTGRNGKGRKFIQLDAEGNILTTSKPKIIKRSARNFVDKENGIKVEERINTFYDGDECIARKYMDLDGNMLVHETTKCGGKQLYLVEVYKKDENGLSVLDYILSFNEKNQPTTIQYYDGNRFLEEHAFTGEYKPPKAKQNKFASYFDRLKFKDVEH